MPSFEKLNQDNLRPHTIWRHRKDGEWEYVYLENLTSKLIRNGEGYVDYRTPFGLHHLPRTKFLKNFFFVGNAILKITELTAPQNIYNLQIKLGTEKFQHEN